MLSMLAKYIPGGVWTPAARVVATRRAGIDNTSVVLATILLEAGLSAVAGVIVLAASLPFVDGVDAPVWPVVGFAVLALGLLHPRVFAPLATRLSRRFGGSVIEPLPWATGIGVLLFYCFTWLVGGRRADRPAGGGRRRIPASRRSPIWAAPAPWARSSPSSP